MDMKKQNKIKITQENGFIKIYRNDEYEQGYDLNWTVDAIKEGKMSNVSLANWIAEIINDSLNCKTASSMVQDLNDTRSYRGTYFESIDFME